MTPEAGEGEAPPTRAREPRDSGNAAPLRPEELDRVLALDAETRAEWMLEDCARHEEAWGLADAEGWVVFQLKDHPPERKPWALPLWPRQELAALNARGAQEQPRRLDLGGLLEGLVPELEGRSWQVQACPWREEGLLLAAAEFGRRLEAAWDEWEDEDV